uniref:Serine/threonine-protein phosphatase n=1 Tax=Ascaris lumbricoides TaxID=6252 RepID=A0A0M3HMM0_ASCLU
MRCAFTVRLIGRFTSRPRTVPAICDVERELLETGVVLPIERRGDADDVENVGSKVDYTVEELLPIIKQAKEVISAEPMLLEVRVPCVIVGDIHGQYEDLHRIFSIFSSSKKSGAVTKRYLFLGDYVDRGRNSLECICCLLAHKLFFPRMFYLLRGNHESQDINQIYGFLEEIQRRFPNGSQATTLWKAFNDLFSYFPLAAIVHGKILCMHGGISPKLTSLDDIRKIRRPLHDPNDNELGLDLLWSDPMLDLTGFIKNSLRGVSVFFGEDTVSNLCTRLCIDLIVRAHQMMMNGYGFFCRRKLVTIFSAPNYLPERVNKGAILNVSKDLKLGFSVLCPVTPETRGKQKFVEFFNKYNDNSSYVSRKAAAEGFVYGSLDDTPTVYRKPDGPVQ